MNDDPRSPEQEDDTATTKPEQDSTTPGSGDFPSEQDAQSDLPGVPEDAEGDDAPTD